MKTFKQIINRIITRIDEPYEKIAYILFSLAFFAFVYWLVSNYIPGSFSDKMNPITSLYFSTITNFTIGFGDIKPVFAISKIIVILQALIFWFVMLG